MGRRRRHPGGAARLLRHVHGARKSWLTMTEAAHKSWSCSQPDRDAESSRDGPLQRVCSCPRGRAACWPPHRAPGHNLGRLALPEARAHPRSAPGRLRRSTGCSLRTAARCPPGTRSARTCGPGGGRRRDGAQRSAAAGAPADGSLWCSSTQGRQSRRRYPARPRRGAPHPRPTPPHPTPPPFSHFFIISSGSSMSSMEHSGEGS